jgi:hypothetical protein
MTEYEKITTENKHLRTLLENLLFTLKAEHSDGESIRRSVSLIVRMKEAEKFLKNTQKP